MDEFNEKMEKTLKEFKEKAKKRQEYNIKCLKIVINMVFNKPDLRFGQLMSNFFGWLMQEKGVDLFFPEEDKMINYIITIIVDK